MSGHHYDGGPAFPFVSVSQNQSTGETTVHQGDGGMTLRDYFAAKAMHAIYTRFGGSPSAGNDHDGSLTHAATDAYAMADAMLKARSA
jgi:hypothetical protein